MSVLVLLEHEPAGIKQPSRSAVAAASRLGADVHVLVTGDATEAIVAQIERFAPGFRDRVVGHTVSTTTQFAADNPNFVGGDIMTGAKDIRQLVFGPRITLAPYRIGVPGMYICSAATPPGPGAHGMCGANAGQTALRDLGARGQAS